MFDDIRPFRDDELATVIQRLINEPELQASVAHLVMPRLFKVFPGLCKKIIKLSLSFRQKHFSTTDKIHFEVAKYLTRIIDKSSQGFTYNGLEKLKTKKPALFISNHRDIILDAALVDLALYKEGIQTVEAAVGDNLLTKPWVSDLMRINKSFIVKRSEKTKRAMLNASKELSAYIHHSITERKQNTWIAQREGRAKDGLDITNPALISMLLLNKEKTTSIEDYLEQINIIPVAISYELDPCDQQKAIELSTIESTGEYKKSDDEDVNSMIKGLMGDKGRIHIEFCAPIKGNFENSKAIAEAIDQQIISHYKLFDTNTAAFEHLSNDVESKPTTSPLLDVLAQRMDNLTHIQQQRLLSMYANPVVAKNSL
jgi:glycerol-3-phosphate O-acyltransferase